MIGKILIVAIIISILYVICKICKLIENLYLNILKYFKLKIVKLECEIYKVNINNYDDLGNIKRKEFLE